MENQNDLLENKIRSEIDKCNFEIRNIKESLTILNTRLQETEDRKIMLRSLIGD